MGGAAGFMFRCTSCGGREVKFNTSSERENGSPALSAALQVAFICAGASYAQYRRVLRHTFGLRCVSGSTFYRRIEEMYEHVKAILDDICLEERQQMKDMDQNELGSWSRAVTCADAVWLTRGGFSRNCTFTVRNYMTGALCTIITSVKKERTRAKKTCMKVLQSQQKDLELTTFSVLWPNMELLLNATFKMVIAQQGMQC